MRNLPHGRAALDAYIGDLRRLKQACCVPSDRELVRLAPEVIAAHREAIPTLRPLTAAVLSDVMSRKRQRPPAWGWVATYVLTCLRFVDKSGIRLDFDGPGTLQGWCEYYQTMLDHLTPVAVTGCTPPTAAMTAGEDSPSDEERRDQMETAPKDGPGSAPPPVPPPVPPAGSAPPAPAEVLSWQDLHDAALDDWMHQLRRQQSMAHRRYHELFGQHGTATVAGLLGATIRMGLIYEARGELTAALHTFAQAAAHAHLDGLRHFERLNNRLSQAQDTSHPDQPTSEQ